MKAAGLTVVTEQPIMHGDVDAGAVERHADEQERIRPPRNLEKLSPELFDEVVDAHLAAVRAYLEHFRAA